MSLKNKTILVISPQSWGQMFISKHHYAITLAKMGNRVYFLNPPEIDGSVKKGQISITTSCIHHNLLLVSHSLKFPFALKFHATWLFHQLMEFHVKGILKKINEPVDIIWSFDQGNLYPFKFFGTKPFKIFQPVDEPTTTEAIKAAEGSQVILSVTKEILEKYSDFNQPKHLINHGIGEDFLFASQVAARRNRQIHVGFAGNLLRQDIDRDILLKIIKQNPDTVFECWGCYRSKDNNIGGFENMASRLFISRLKKKGVVLHGPVSPLQLARGLQQMDAFLICYDIKKDQSRGTNYHKIMEYLSTGKIIISNNVTSYQDRPDLVQMTRSRENNEGLPRLVKSVLQHLDYYNSPLLQQRRIDYARQNTYTSQVAKIERLISDVFKVA